ncbi:MAG: IS91 family transposase [Deltaproteobacteria bacterium]|nr:IS91 family transposase [Deltaproteobacteria bacterium]
MTRISKNNGKPSVEVADVLREHIGDYQRTHSLCPEHYKIVYDLLNCRTAYLGGHIQQCDHCGTERIMYNSCRNRHCPKCQNMPRERWLEARKAELLPVIYFHNVFTLPHELNPLILSNKAVMLGILFKSVSETLLVFGRNPKNGLCGKLGFITILHTWDQLLNAHFHLHCLTPGGAVSDDWTRWKFIDQMKKVYKKGKLHFPGLCAPYETPQGFKQLIDSLYSKKWVVHVKESIKCSEYVFEYLGRYTHRVAISNHRLVSFENGQVAFTYKNRKTEQIQQTTIEAVEFIRRFLLHALPNGFVKIRHYGFLANRNRRKNLAKIRQLHALPQIGKAAEKSVEEMMLSLTGADISLCPCCGKGKMQVIREIPKYTGICAKDIIRPPN